MSTACCSAFVSCCIVFAHTLFMSGIRGDHPSEEALSKDTIKIIKIILITFGEYILRLFQLSLSGLASTFILFLVRKMIPSNDEALKGFILQ